MREKDSSVFTKEQMKKLKDAEPHFYTAVNFQYKLNTSRQLNDKVADIYEERTGEVVSRNWACGNCTYKLFRKAGIIYFNTLKNETLQG